MNRLFRYKNFMLNFIYFLMVFSLIQLAGTMISLDLSLTRQILLAFVVTMSAKLFVQNRIIFYFSIFIIIIGSFIVANTITQGYPYLEKLMMFLNNIYEHIFMEGTVLEENILPFWILIMTVYSVFTSIIIFKLKQGLWTLILIYLPLFIHYWYFDIAYTYLALAIFLFSYFILYGQSKFNREKNKAGAAFKRDFSKLAPVWSKTTLIYGILIIVIAFLLPKSSNRVHWLWMENKISSIMPKLEIIRLNNNEFNIQANRFNFATTGFQQDTSRLGGPISPNKKLIMKVRANGTTYLRGTVRHHYDGNMWKTIETNRTKHLLGDNFNGIDSYDRKEYYDEIDVEVQFENYASTTLFSPYMTIDINAENKTQVTITSDNIMEIPEGIYDNETYRITALQTPSYYEALNFGINNSYKDIENIEYYLQVPINKITQRTIDLKDEIISGIEGNYEKAIAFESYLRNNYKYTLNTSPVPEGHEFIDYFLFEEQAGYCTYYATAMSIFLRLEGIPSRYVEGYIAYETSDGEVYKVRQNHAHAWVEGYIEPVGWITFEPTSYYALENRESNDDLDNENEEITQEEEPNEVEDIPEEQESTNNDSHELNDDSNTENLIIENSVSSQNIMLNLIGLIFFLIIILVLIKILQNRKNERHLNNLANDKKMIILYQKILRLIESLGYPKNLSETHYEYSNRIGHKFAPLKEITDIFVRNKYGNTMPSDEEIQKFADYCKELDKQ